MTAPPSPTRPSPLGPRLVAALDRLAQPEASDVASALPHLTLAPRRIAAGRKELLTVAEELRQRWLGGEPARRPAFVEPSPDFSPAAEGRFVDLLRLAGGPSLLLASRTEADGRLRFAPSHSGFLVPWAGSAMGVECPPWPEAPAPPAPVVGPELAPLADWALLPWARGAADLPRARRLRELVFTLAGPALELIRLWAEPAALRSAAQWRARPSSRAEAEEEPNTALLLALLRAAGLDSDPARPSTVWRVHDPACHHGTVLRRLGAEFPTLELHFADQDPHWLAVTAARLAAAGLAGQAEAPGPLSELPGLAPESLDLLLLRAANRGVVSPAEAQAALARAAQVLRVGGVLVVNGFSCPLVQAGQLAAQGLVPLLRTARQLADPLHGAGIVPFYLAFKVG